LRASFDYGSSCGYPTQVSQVWGGSTLFMAENSDIPTAGVGVKLDVMDLVNKTIELAVRVKELEVERSTLIQANNAYWQEVIEKERKKNKELRARISQLESK